jgi:hypothetical protein
MPYLHVAVLDVLDDAVLQVDAAAAAFPIVRAPLSLDRRVILTKPRSKGYCDYRDHFFP